MTDNNAYVQQINVSKWGSKGTASGSITIAHGDGGFITLRCSKEDIEQLWQVAMLMFERNKMKFAKQIEDIKPMELLGYNEEKTINHGDDVPL